MKTSTEKSNQYWESVGGFWGEIQGMGIITGAYGGMEWDELPEHAKADVAAVFEAAIGRDRRQLLACLGFVKGTGFAGEVWTNPDSEHLAQVWVMFESQETLQGSRWAAWWDATGGLDVAAFFKWWETRSADEHCENR